MDVFVDTSAWYALLNRRDAFHGAAARIFRRLRDEAARLATTNYVVVETTALVAARLGRIAARRWMVDLLPVAEVLWVDRGVHEAAVAAFLGARGGTSLVDLVSFEVMRRAGLRRAFAFDKVISVQPTDGLTSRAGESNLMSAVGVEGVAQVVRALGCGPKGCGFESHHPPQDGGPGSGMGRVRGPSGEPASDGRGRDRGQSAKGIGLGALGL